MEKINVRLKRTVDDSYEILVGSNILSDILKDLQKKGIGNKYALITDDNVKTLFGSRLQEIFRRENMQLPVVSFPAGEKSKSLRTFAELQGKIHSLGLDRKSAIIALGGGVVGDIAGFVAATYFRGIPFVQIPTTLLAMIDSSIGGKVGVDLEQGKNACGAFFQPKAVYVDIDFLEGLPRKELQSGLAEIIKHALIFDSRLFEFLEKNLRKLISKDKASWMHVIQKNCRIKAAVVEKDEKESGARKMLNYGHTVGHAVETVTQYKKFSHGEAVSMGMSFASRLSVKLGLLSERESLRSTALLQAAGLPVRLPALPIGKMLEVMRKDKKSIGGKLSFVVLERIGKARHDVIVSEELVKEVIAPLMD